jgi:hypothetical protein
MSNLLKLLAIFIALLALAQAGRIRDEVRFQNRVGSK